VRFLVDANLPRSTVAILRTLGHEVEFARDIGLAAAPDREIAARAKGTAAALLTRDLDFADIREYPPEEYPGIIVLRLPDDATAHAIGVAVERFVREEAFLAALEGRVAIVEVDRVRFRPPLV
jgi:predicted nuclease of predicted toxin-antitoxin system